MNLTAAQLSRLRTRPHRTRLWLSVFRPQVVFATQINQAGIAKGARDITVTGISGSSLSALSGMTVYIGTTQGGKELGRIRLRSATASQLVLAENSITWVNGWFLTVVRYFEPWGVFPRIILDGNNNPVFYKDWDIAYTDQNHKMDPVICMGPNHAGFLAVGSLDDNPAMFRDTFTGANGTLLTNHTPDLGYPGEAYVMTGTFSIENNMVFCSGQSDEQNAAIYDVHFHDFAMDFDVSTGSTSGGVVMRALDLTHYTELMVRRGGAPNELVLRERDGGTLQVIGVSSPGIDHGDSFRVTAVGNYWTVYWNGTEQFMATGVLSQLGTKFGPKIVDTDFPQWLDNVVIRHAPASPTAQVWYTSSGSYNPTPGGSLSSLDWHFEGGDPTGSVADHPGWVTYTGAGQYVTSLAITSSEGKSFTGRRHISILARPEDPGPFRPVMAWGLTDMSGSREAGGYEGNIWIREPANPEDIVDGALVVIFSESFEGGVETKVGANAENRGEIFFVGHVMEDSIRYDPETNVVDFKIGGLTSRMNELSTFSTALDDKRNAQSWTDMRDMTLDRALVHFLRWHSTVLAVADFSPTGDLDAVEFIDFQRGNVGAAVSDLTANAVLGQVVADRQGKIWAELDASLEPTGSTRQASGHMQSVVEITRQDWRSEVSIDRRPQGGTAYIELGGIAYSGKVTGTFNAYLSGAPGEAPGYFGTAERVSGLIITSQTQLNGLSGLAYAKANALYPKVTVPLAGDYRFLDVAPQHRVEMTVLTSDTFRRIAWTRKPFIPSSISFEYRADEQVLLMEVELAEETHGPPGDTVIIPVDPPYDSSILPDWDIDFPPIIVPDPVVPPVMPPPGTGHLVYFNAGGRLFRSRDFSATGTSWKEITPDWPGTHVTGSIEVLRLSENDPLNTAYLMTESAHFNVSNPNDMGGSRLYRINGLNNPTGSISYTLIMEPADYRGVWAGSNFQSAIRDFSVSPVSENLIWILGFDTALGDTKIAKTSDAGGTWVNATGNLSVSVPRNNAKIFASKKSIADCFTIGLNGLFFTQNQGAVWASLVAGDGFYGVVDYHVPDEDNPADLIIYYGNDEQPVHLYASPDRGGIELDVSPDFNGMTWGIPRSAANLGTMDAILTHPLDKFLVAALLQANDGSEPGSNDPCILFLSVNGVAGGPSSLFPRYQFPNRAWPLAWHKTNPLRMATLSAGTGNRDDKMWISEDGGMTFVNITYAFNRDIPDDGGARDIIDQLLQAFSGSRQIMYVWTI